MLTELLHAMGLFVGWRLDSHHESTFHQRLNRRLTSEAGGHWSRPEAVADVIDSAQVSSLVDPLRPHLDGVAAIEYWGPNYRRRHEVEAWGWKDPRNGYLLPLWQAMYPNLRVIWIRRDPRETSESLYRRSLATRAELETASHASGLKAAARRARASYQGHPILADAVAALDPEGCLDIAISYERVHHRYLRPTASHTLEVTYPDLLNDPNEVLRSCAEHIGLPWNGRVGSGANDLVQRPRLDRTSPTWRAIEQAANNRHAELVELGYVNDRLD